MPGRPTAAVRKDRMPMPHWQRSMSAKVARTLVLAGAVLTVQPSAAREPAWHDAVRETVAETCAIRGLDLKTPLRVLPMDSFQGGYTAGIGSVSWEAHPARVWREGWCALGVYCDAPSAVVEDALPDRPSPTPETTSDAHSPDQSPHELASLDDVSGDAYATLDTPAESDEAAGTMSSPAGLYDVERNVLFVRALGDAKDRRTIAHETVHALQYQHFPALDAVHLWRNRDLAAAANAAIEGDAHVVGWSFDQATRTLLCSMDPDRAAQGHIDWWQWRPDTLSAFEAFPHVFGTEFALRTVLVGGLQAMNARLAEPPLSTLAVLRPSLAHHPVDFIRLPDDLGVDGCEAGLRNTAGVVGIWGLLTLHGATSALTPTGDGGLPSFLEAWRGDRFVHVSCPGSANDEFLWLSRWESEDAAVRFATEYGHVADTLPAYGGVLGDTPVAAVTGTTVTVATPRLAHWQPDSADIEVRPLSTLGDWVANRCFPDTSCDDATSPADEAAEGGFRCPTTTVASTRLTGWLTRIRQARAATAQSADDGASLLPKVAALARLCALNVTHDRDRLTACRATYSGVRFVVGLQSDANYRLLPYCLSEAQTRNWVRQNFLVSGHEAINPELKSSTDSSWHGPPLDDSRFATIWGAARAAKAYADHGVPGLQGLLDSPPLTTRALLSGDGAGVDLIRPRHAALTDHGCEAAASHVQGALGIWRLLDEGSTNPSGTVPAFLSGWRGDLLFRVACHQPEGAGWVWHSRWSTPTAAEAFAASYGALSPATLAEAELPQAKPLIDGVSVWLVDPALTTLKERLSSYVDVIHVSSLTDWIDANCFPQTACN